jgi:hypothetical protein
MKANSGPRKWKAKIDFFKDEKVTNDFLYVTLSALSGKRKKLCNVKATIDKKITRTQEFKNAVISTTGAITANSTSEYLMVRFFTTRSKEKDKTWRTLEINDFDKVFFSCRYRFQVEDPDNSLIPINVD